MKEMKYSLREKLVERVPVYELKHKDKVVAWGLDGTSIVVKVVMRIL